MDPCPPPNILINVRNRFETETVETRRSNVSIRVERIVIEYMLEPYAPSPITNYRHESPEFITFDITSATTLSHIFHILLNRYFWHELSQDLASQIFQKATTLIDLDSNPITIDVLLTITLNRMASVNTKAFLANIKAKKLVRDGVIGEKSGLEMELCSICLEGLFQVSEKVPTRMPCSHVFHGHCIIRWLVRDNSCPSCRQVLFEHDEEDEKEDE